MAPYRGRRPVRSWRLMLCLCSVSHKDTPLMLLGSSICAFNRCVGRAVHTKPHPNACLPPSLRSRSEARRVIRRGTAGSRRSSLYEARDTAPLILDRLSSCLTLTINYAHTVANGEVPAYCGRVVSRPTPSSTRNPDHKAGGGHNLVPFLRLLQGRITKALLMAIASM
ncbi:hypothetical protein C8Q78DRAFT_755885 [Trametes maxima]|nr:hypothetical protein C8Q78DRAFT_755885 [Trametes maxima]